MNAPRPSLRERFLAWWNPGYTGEMCGRDYVAVWGGFLAVCGLAAALVRALL